VYFHLCQRLRIDALSRDTESLQLAKRIAFAFHEPKRLEDERYDLLDRIGRLPTREDAMERGLKTLKDLAEIDRRRAVAAAAGGGSDGGR
jgi:hypothetical protein